MKKMGLISVLLLIAALPACNNCCWNKKEAAPVEAVEVQETDILVDPTTDSAAAVTFDEQPVAEEAMMK